MLSSCEMIMNFCSSAQISAQISVWTRSSFPKPKRSFGNELVPYWNQCPHLPDLGRKLIPRQLLASIITVVTWVHTSQMGAKFGVISWICMTFHCSVFPSPDNRDWTYLSSFIFLLLYSICPVMADHTQLKFDLRNWKFKLPIVSLKCHQNTQAYHIILFRRCTFHVTFLKAKAVI